MSDRASLFVTEAISVPDWELTESFIRASGPGGQNVNKVASAVQLRWTAETSSISAAVKARFISRYRSRLTSAGELILEAKEHRSQALNREAARKRLADMIKTVAEPPKKRIRTRPTKGSVRRRLKAKKVRSTVKALRGKIGDED